MESSFRSAINVSFRITITVSHHSGWDTKLVDLDDGVLRSMIVCFAVSGVFMELVW